MTLHEFLELYGFHGKKRTCQNPKAICWEVCHPTTADLIRLFSRKSYVQPNIQESMLTMHHSWTIYTLYVPVAICNPTEATVYNADIIHFNVSYATETGRYLNSSHPSIIVFSKSLKNNEYVDRRIFKTFEECANACDKLNTLERYNENNLQRTITYMEFYYKVFSLWQNLLT